MKSEDAKVGMILIDNMFGDLHFIMQHADFGGFYCTSLGYKGTILMTGNELRKIDFTNSDLIPLFDMIADSKHKYIRNIFCAYIQRLTK